MGTRSTTQIKLDETPLLTFYRQYDGYPSGHGLDILALLQRQSVNGFTNPNTQYNGAENFAAMLIASVIPRNREGKVQCGNIYVEPHEHFGQQEYNYLIAFSSEEAEPTVTVTGRGLDPKPLSIAEFAELCETEA